MKEIKLCGRNGIGKIMLVDDEDYEKFNKHKWYYHGGYAITVKHISGSHSKKNIVQKNIIAHRYVFDLEKGDDVVIDHINHNGLDNRKENLRRTDYMHNSWNCIRTKNQCGFIGVCKESDNCYKASHCGIIIGYYKTSKMAALAYDREIRKTRNEFAVLNFPDICDYSGIIKSDPHNKFQRTSKVTGVSYSHCRKAKEKWRVVKYKKHLGWFLTEQDAINFLENWMKCNENKEKENN